jgi:hypothetical protein
VIESILAWLASKGVGIILGAIFGAANDYASKRKAEAAQRDAGAAEATAQTNKETADAQRRASDAMLNTGDLDDLVDDLSKGKF